jgi:serine protease Do
MTSSGAAGAGTTTYSIFFSPAAHVEQLVAANDLDGASQVYEQEQEWFAAGGESREAPLRDLAARLEAQLAPRIGAAQQSLDAVSWPAAREQWPGIKAAMDAAGDAMAEADGHRILSEPRYRPTAIARLDAALTALRQRLEADAAQAFLDYPLASAPSFAASYPLEIPLETALAGASWQGRLAGYDHAGLMAIAQTYGGDLPEAMAQELGRAIYAAASAGGGLAAAMAAVVEVRGLGLEIDAAPDSRAVLVDVTSHTLMRQNALDFPIDLDTDLPFETVQAGLDDAFDAPAAGSADVIVLIDLASARVDRRIAGQEDVPSEVMVGTQTVPNPAYVQAALKLDEAMMSLQQIKRQNAINLATPCSGLGCTLLGIGGIVGEAAVQERLRAAQEVLTKTPMTLTEPVYQPYSYSRTTIEATKVATVHYHVIDRRAGTYLRDSFDLNESATFTVAYGVHAQDRHREAALSATDAEADVAAFEEAPVGVKLSQILSRFARVGSRAEALPSLETLRAQILADQNTAIAAQQARTYEATTGDDAGDGGGRFDSVVMVYHASGFGSGFYVASDLVLTNFHVIEDFQFVEIKLFSGLETTGKVIASDPRLDLALVKVGTRGRPVTFYAGRTLPLGAEVELIGHPDGFEFSITRGIVSALRERESLNVPGGKKVRFIQTDAAINGGNSGGPMFLGDQVIGVNTWKLVAVELEGLSFAVHYGEVLEFLARNGVAPGTGS